MIQILIKDGIKETRFGEFATVEEAIETAKKAKYRTHNIIWIEKKLSDVEAAVKNVPLNTIEWYSI